MIRFLFTAAAGLALAAGAHTQVVKDFVPVTGEMLLHPSPDEWLMYSRTYDAQRFSPLKQIDKSNVAQLRMAWTRGLGPGTSETIPIVHNGVMYLVEPGAIGRRQRRAHEIKRVGDAMGRSPQGLQIDRRGRRSAGCRRIAARSAARTPSTPRHPSRAPCATARSR